MESLSSSKSFRFIRAAFVLLAASCGTGGGIIARHKQPDVSAATANLTLKKVEGCENVEKAIKDDLLSKMRQRIAYSRSSAKQYASQSISRSCYDGRQYADAASPASGVANSAPNDSTSSAASEYTTTNNQVGGVDEADVVKNDGEFIYTVSGGKFLIVRAYPVSDMRIVSETAIEGFPEKIFVSSDRALVYSRTYDANYGASCNYGGYRGGYFYGSGSHLKITLLDISKRRNAADNAPVVEREITTTGEFVGARLIGKVVHTVVGFEPRLIESQLQTWPTDINLYDCRGPVSVGAIDAAFDALEQKNAEKIAALGITDLLPAAKDVDHQPGGDDVRENVFAGCGNFYIPQYEHDSGYLSTMSFPIDDDSRLSMTTTADRAGIVYASAENLYVASPRFSYSDYGGYSSSKSDEGVVIHKFALDKDGGEAAYRGSSGDAVKGHLVNQFAMDEYEGRLRVATSIGHLPDPAATNALYVLGEGQDEATHELRLVVKGVLSDIAKTEDIRSVRFDGNRGFLVTFKKTDPLFTFDLSNPEEPKITGELKIPGFSTYMHFMDDTHLLTLGFDASDQGSFAWFTGIALQIFDVTNMGDPKLIHKHLIGSRGTTSDATSDHLAFTFMKSRGLLALPMGICEGGNSNGGYGSQMTFNGLMVFKVSVDKGFEEMGRVDHTVSNDASNQNGCYNWWQNPNSDVKRSIIMSGQSGDYVYSISPVMLKATNLVALSPSVNATSENTISLPQNADAQACSNW